MNTISLARACFAMVALFGVAHIDAAASDVTAHEVGMVVDYSPARSTQSIKRGAATLPVKLGTLVMAGDVVQVNAGGRVFVQLNDGTQHDVGPGEWQVPDAKPLGPVASLLRSLPRLLDVQARIASSASTRGGEGCDAADPNVVIEAPILRARSKVTAGEQNLALGWFGGCAPFAVDLTKGTVAVAGAKGLKRRQQQFVDLDLTPGQYQLRIADAAGHTKVYGIDVVETAPAPPADLESADSATAAIARALWLAELDAGAWRLESFKTLRPLMAQKERIAALIGDYLLVSTDDDTKAPPTTQ
jgi:hypothetical protein